MPYIRIPLRKKDIPAREPVNIRPAQSIRVVKKSPALDENSLIKPVSCPSDLVSTETEETTSNTNCFKTYVASRERVVSNKSEALRMLGGSCNGE